MVGGVTLLLCLSVVCAYAGLVCLSSEDLGGAWQWTLVPGIHVRHYSGLPLILPFGGREWVIQGWLNLRVAGCYTVLHRGDGVRYDFAVVADASYDTWSIVVR
jgi:hypothetical protein